MSVPDQRDLSDIITIDLSPVTRAMLFGFVKALGEKLSAAEKKYGRSDDWSRQDWEGECRQKLKLHLEKGDPLDVAAYCAFMWERNWPTAEPNGGPETNITHPGDDRAKLSEAQSKLDASVTPEQAAISVARERKAMDDRKRYENTSTAERCRLQGDGFINDYD